MRIYNLRQFIFVVFNVLWVYFQLEPAVSEETVKSQKVFAPDVDDDDGRKRGKQNADTGRESWPNDREQ